MASVFDLTVQHEQVSLKIVAALERLSQVFRLLLREEGKKHRLSPIQIQFLVYMLTHREGLCRISRIAEEFGLTQATVSDAIAVLEKKRLLLRLPCPEDGRMLTLQLTPDGERLALKLSGWADEIQRHLARFPEDEQETVLRFLLHFIELLQKSGIIPVTRMCFTCAFFRANAHVNPKIPHHCGLMDKPLPIAELRWDCPDHQKP